MKLVASAVEANLVNTGLLGTIGNHAADDRRGRLVSAVFELGSNFGVPGAGRDQRGSRLIVDHLRVDVLRAAKDRQPRPFGGPEHPVTDPPLATQPAGLHQTLLVCDVHATILKCSVT